MLGALLALSASFGFLVPLRSPAVSQTLVYMSEADASGLVSSIAKNMTDMTVIGGLTYAMKGMKVEFAAIDADGDGLISAEELAILMSRVGEESTPEQIDEMMQLIDVRNRNEAGEPLIFFEQWVKVIGDKARAEMMKDRPKLGFFGL